MSRRSLVALALGAALLAGPSPGAAAPLRLPPTTKTTLKNGLTVIVMPNDRLPLVDFLLQVKAGSASDPQGKEGLASLTADLLTQGAGARSARQIAEDIDFVGGSLESDAAEERISISCEVLKKDFATGLGLLRDVVVRPGFPAEECARKKSEALGEIASAKDEPAAIADRELLPFLLGTHPLAHPVIGWETSVQAITRDDVVGFHRRHFAPDNAMLAVVGDVDPRAVIAALETAFASWKPSGETRPAGYPPITGTSKREVLLVARPEATQSQIRLACPGVPRNHPDYYPIVVANTILGGGFTSRLVTAIRVEQGLTYGISSRFRMQKSAGQYVVSTSTRNETLRKCIDETLKVIAKLRAEGPTQEEVDKAHRYLAGQYPLGLQAPDAIAEQLLAVEYFGLPADYLSTFADRVSAVTLADCRRVLQEHFCTDQMRVLVVTTPDAGRQALEGLGPLAVREPK